MELYWLMLIGLGSDRISEWLQFNQEFKNYAVTSLKYNVRKQQRRDRRKEGVNDRNKMKKN